MDQELIIFQKVFNK